MHLGTPEAYLKTLVRQLNSVNVATGYLPEEEREEFVPELHRALRACQMISLIYGHTVIAVAGSQGAEKPRWYASFTAWMKAGWLATTDRVSGYR